MHRAAAALLLVEQLTHTSSKLFRGLRCARVSFLVAARSGRGKFEVQV